MNSITRQKKVLTLDWNIKLSYVSMAERNIKSIFNYAIIVQCCHVVFHQVEVHHFYRPKNRNNELIRVQKSNKHYFVPLNARLYNCQWQKTLPKITQCWKPFLPFKRELQTANATTRPWSRDILRFSVCHEKPDVMGLQCFAKDASVRGPYARQCSSNSLSLHPIYIFKNLLEISTFLIQKMQKKVAEIVGSPNRFLRPDKRRHLGRRQCENSVRCGRLLVGSILMPFVPADVFAAATFQVCWSMPSIFSRLERQRRSRRCSC